MTLLETSLSPTPNGQVHSRPTWSRGPRRACHDVVLATDDARRDGPGW